ncbi:hypothetical protein [Arenibacter palladensis]|uniref:hypothetical protein n=1 Tax=Arenibacter palladensis TaxID=237373 RepID=UPI0026E15990|nr:hypothetical protein [Arenibacter palladensis]MDO6602492.1 hypothetical protein [Arenibacter palladensis]
MNLQERFKYWKNEPDESPYRRIYDEHTMTFVDFLGKHYSDEKYLNWSRWNKWVSWIQKAYQHEEMEVIRKMGGYYRLDTNSQDYVTSFKRLELGIQLPTDICQVIAFLVVDGFFKHYSVEPKDWIDMDNYTNPKNSNGRHTINELAKSYESLNYLRESLIHLPWWDLTRGDPQGR